MAKATGIALLGLLAFASLARAERAAPTKVILVAARNQEPMLKAVIPSIASQLGDLPVLFLVEWVDSLGVDLAAQQALAQRVGQQSGATAVFWFDRRPDNSTNFLLASVAEGRILVRTINETEAGSLAESMAVIVRISIGAMLGPAPAAATSSSHRSRAVIRLSGALALIADHPTERVTADLAGTSGTKPSWEIAVTPFLRAGLRIFANVEGVLMIGAEAPLRRTRYWIERDDGRRAQVNSWTLRPLFLLGVSVGYSS